MTTPTTFASASSTTDRTAAGPRTELTASELAAWDRNGYHIHDRLFSETEIAEVRDACNDVAHHRYRSGHAPDMRGWEPGAPAKAVCKIDNTWKSDERILSLVCSPLLGRIAAQLIRADGIRLWHDQYLHKPASGGGIVTWHQDWMYWQSIDRCRTVTCWIALCDVTPESGPMVFLQGSHLSGLRMELKPQGWTGKNLPPPPIDGLPIVPVVMRAGQVSFHHGMLHHASDCNTGAKDRISIVSHLMADDCEFRPGQEHSCITRMRDFPDHPAPGERFRGPQFPYAWKSDGRKSAVAAPLP